MEVHHNKICFASTQPARAKHLICATQENIHSKITTPRTTDIQGADNNALSYNFHASLDNYLSAFNSFGRRHRQPGIKPAFLSETKTCRFEYDLTV